MEDSRVRNEQDAPQPEVPATEELWAPPSEPPTGAEAGRVPPTSAPWAAPPGEPPPPPAPPWPDLPRFGPPEAAPAAPVGRASKLWVAVAAVAALLGALVGGGLVAALDDDGGTAREAAPTRNTSVIAEPQDIQGILAKVEPAVVSIQTDRGSAGTGMILTPDGEVLTNAHVVEGAGRIRVTLFGESRPREAELVGLDPRPVDVALLKIRDAKDLPTVEIGRSSDIEVGDAVVAIGNALALPGSPSVTSGIVSAKERPLDEGDVEGSYIQTDAAINSGNSGGPLANAKGQVIGMNTFVIRGSASGAAAEGLGFAIPSDRFMQVVERLRKGDRPVVSRAFLGVSTQTLTPEIAQQYDFGVDRGAIVAAVESGSPADEAGIERLDVIVRFDGKTVESADQLVDLVRAKQPGDKVEVVVVRDGEERTVTATLGQRQVAADQ